MACNRTIGHPNFGDPVPPSANLTSGIAVASICGAQGGLSAGNVRMSADVGFALPLTVSTNGTYHLRAVWTYAATLRHAQAGRATITLHFHLAFQSNSTRVANKFIVVNSTMGNVTHAFHWNGTLLANSTYIASMWFDLTAYTGHYGVRFDGYASAAVQAQLVAVYLT